MKLSKIYRKTQKSRMPPGSLVYTGNKQEKPLKMSIIDYSPETVDIHDEIIFNNFDDFPKQRSGIKVRWINILGVNNPKTIQELGDKYNIHPLVLEDILNITQRPKIEEFAETFSLIFKMIYFDNTNSVIKYEQVSLLVGEDYVISLQEKDEDAFTDLIKRIILNKGFARKYGPDYLCFAILDSIVDGYYEVLESLADQIESLEDQVMENPQKDTLTQLYQIKREILGLWKNVYPIRELIGKLTRLKTTSFSSEILLFYRDTYDHIIQIIDDIENLRDIINSLLDLYLSTVNHKMNERMKLLTIISTIFIPITFITSLYGMNFENIPELAWSMGYYFLWGIIILTIFGQLVYFKKNDWF